jgi:tRNA U34 5-carboxymethylaminomethyl modifying GTPase MnmE/TrmE
MEYLKARHDTLQRSLVRIVKTIERKIEYIEKGKPVSEFADRNEMLTKLKQDIVHYRGVLHGVECCQKLFY